LGGDVGDSAVDECEVAEHPHLDVAHGQAGERAGLAIMPRTSYRLRNTRSGQVAVKSSARNSS
jgi:hypothetical protein